MLMLAAVVEECVFRGGMQHVLRMTGWGRSRALGLSFANIATAAAFGLSHGVLRDWWLVPVAALVGLGLGALYDKHQRLMPCVLAHAGLNGLWWLIRPIGVGTWW